MSEEIIVSTGTATLESVDIPTARAERAAIVKWLRDEAEKNGGNWGIAVRGAASAIERGDHQPNHP